MPEGPPAAGPESQPQMTPAFQTQNPGWPGPDSGQTPFAATNQPPYSVPSQPFGQMPPAAPPQPLYAAPAAPAQPFGQAPPSVAAPAFPPPAQPGRKLTADGLPNPYNAPPPPDPFMNTQLRSEAGSAPHRQPPAPKQASAAPIIDPSLQTVVCPKCKFTAGIPPVTGKLRLRCQECGHIFAIKPDPRFKHLTKAAGTRGGRGQKGSKPILLLLVILALAAAVVLVGPKVLPGVIPNILPF